MNPLIDIVSPAWRKRCYVLYALACVVVGAMAVAGVATGSARDVLVYVGAALGLTAASNTSTTAPKAVNLTGSAAPKA